MGTKWVPPSLECSGDQMSRLGWGWAPGPGSITSRSFSRSQTRPVLPGTKEGVLPEAGLGSGPGAQPRPLRAKLSRTQGKGQGRDPVYLVPRPVPQSPGSFHFLGFLPPLSLPLSFPPSTSPSTPNPCPSELCVLGVPLSRVSLQSPPLPCALLPTSPLPSPGRGSWRW